MCGSEESTAKGAKGAKESKIIRESTITTSIFIVRGLQVARQNPCAETKTPEFTKAVWRDSKLVPLSVSRKMELLSFAFFATFAVNAFRE